MNKFINNDSYVYNKSKNFNFNKILINLNLISKNSFASKATVFTFILFLFITSLSDLILL